MELHSHHQCAIETSAHGRVNLIGEHTDYNGGFVLPMAIPQSTQVLLEKNLNSREVLISTASLGPESQTFQYELGKEKQRHDWTDYIQGVSWTFHKKGLPLCGFSVWISSTIPIGAGVSSSAGLLVALIKAINEAFSFNLPPIEVALLAQSVENDFVGARVGIMDQMAACLAKKGEALFLDTQDLSFESIPLPCEVFDLFVIDSGIRHNNAHGGYNTRRAECEEAAQLLNIKSLRELSSLSQLDQLPIHLYKRARHVFTENARVLMAVEAIKEKNAFRLGELFVESHASMRDDYEVSLPEMDFLVETTLADSRTLGARLTGGGMGGSIVGICLPGHALEVALGVVERYQAQTGNSAHILVPN